MAEDHRHDDPVDVTVVGDTRDTFGKRLAALAVALLLFTFIILALIQSAKNGKKLDEKPAVIPTPQVTVKIVPMPTPVPIISYGPDGVRVTPVPGGTVVIPGRDGRDGKDGSPGSQPSPSKSPKPSPSRTPVVPVGQTVCDLTGLGCPPRRNVEEPHARVEQPSLRRPEVGGSGGLAGLRSALQGLIAGLGLPKR